MSEGEWTKARLDSLQPWPNKERGVTQDWDEDGITTNPLKSLYCCQAQSKKIVVTTDPESYGDGVKKTMEEKFADGGKKIVLLFSTLLAVLGNGVMHSQDSA